MKIVSWNVNSVRARTANINEYIEENSPDIILFQEIKTQDDSFPYDNFDKYGYKSYVFGQKSYNGVAIISKIEIQKVNKNFIIDDLNQARIITGEINLGKKKVELINIYVPNGNPINTKKYDYKKEWLKKFILNIKKKIVKKSKYIDSW